MSHKAAGGCCALVRQAEALSSRHVALQQRHQQQLEGVELCLLHVLAGTSWLRLRAHFLS